MSTDPRAIPSPRIAARPAETVDYEVVSARGATIKTFSERISATRYARDIEGEFPGCEVYLVIYPAPIRRRLPKAGGRPSNLHLVMT
jgi:hypothetical protein